MGFEPTLCLRWYIKRASLLDIPIIFGASTNLTLGFLLQDIFHHDLRFIALCPSSELHPYIKNHSYKHYVLLADLTVSDLTHQQLPIKAWTGFNTNEIHSRSSSSPLRQGLNLHITPNDYIIKDILYIKLQRQLPSYGFTLLLSFCIMLLLSLLHISLDPF